MLAKYVLSDGISQAFLPFLLVDVIVITDHDLFQILILKVAIDATGPRVLNFFSLVLYCLTVISLCTGVLSFCSGM